MFPELFEPTIFSRRKVLSASRFIRAMHPKTAISPTRVAVKKVLDAGWWGQVKMDGHRAQIHISADPNEKTIVYNRQGTPHKKVLPTSAIAELRRLFALKESWTVIDAEWDKPGEKLYIFDVLKLNGRMLDTYTYAERYELLPRVYSSPMIETLSVLRTVDQCMEVLERGDERIEGLVFKSPTTEGFSDTAIIRCLIKPYI